MSTKDYSAQKFVWLVFGFAAMFLRAAAVFALWGWFVTDVFSVRAITYAQSLGLMFFAALFMAKYRKLENEEMAAAVAQSISTSLTALLFGVVLHWAMT